MDFVLRIVGAKNFAEINAIENFTNFTIRAVENFTNFETVENFTGFKIFKLLNLADFTFTIDLRNLDGNKTKDTTSPEKNTAVQ
jgi:hypothetical protein